jgi:hypothetical protein
MLDRTYNKENFKEAMSIVSIHYKKKKRQIEYEKKFNKAQSKKYKGKGKEFSKLES